MVGAEPATPGERLPRKTRRSANGLKSRLNDVQGGTTETIVDVPLTKLMSQPYLINVHKSAAELSVYVTCGDIMPSGM